MELAQQIKEASALVIKRFAHEGLRVWDQYDVSVDSNSIKVFLDNEVVAEITIEPYEYMCHAIDPDDLLQILESILMIPHE